VRWFVPSWNGDLRLVPHEDNVDHTVLQIEKPTPDEERIVGLIKDACKEAGWPGTTRVVAGQKRIRFAAPMEKVGPIAVKIMKPGPAVLTAITFKDGRVVTSSGSLPELQALAEAVAKEPDEKAATAAVTVKRHTPSCPACVPGSIAPASEVLLQFLSAEEHEDWKRERAITVIGGYTGHRYRIAHRHSKTAQHVGRICYDLDDEVVVHFHDMTVPPEEEVLAAKLIM
jgi:hypothetical protein